MRILKFRFNGEQELRRKLSAKRFDREIIDATLERLRREKWLDDDRFAGAFVRTRMGKRIGRGRIRRELGAAGVERDVADRALNENADPDREREQLVATFQKRLRAMQRRYGDDVLQTPEGRNKMTGYLLKQGYDAALIRSVIKEMPVVDD
jgi:regulatory protein